MHITPNALLVEQAQVVQVLAPVEPTSVAPPRVSMKGYERALVLITVDNDVALVGPPAVPVAGSAIALTQSQTVAGAGQKALPFSRAYRNLDTDSGDGLTEFAVVGDTFDTLDTENANALYAIEVKAEDLDVNGGFDVLGVSAGDATQTVIGILVVLWPARYAGQPLKSARVD